MAERITIFGDYSLEGVYEEPEGQEAWGGVVVAHPHPLHGATMDQPVVYRTAQSCRERGLATLRFNFRGVGLSKGTYSGFDEFRDVEVAALYLRGRLDDTYGLVEPIGRGRPLALAGYSFGSIMAAMAAVGEVPVQALAMIALPVGWEDFPTVVDRLTAFPGPVFALCGEKDGIAPPEEVEQILRSINVDLSFSVVEGADHFFAGTQREVGERVATFLDEALSRMP
jgi:uncharacterized protein